MFTFLLEACREALENMTFEDQMGIEMQKFLRFCFGFQIMQLEFNF